MNEWELVGVQQEQRGKEKIINKNHCYHLLNVLTFCLDQLDHIKRHSTLLTVFS